MKTVGKTITRERLQEIAEDGFLKHGESKELARMALAAMDSEPVAEIMYHPLSIDGGKQKFVQVTGEEHRQLRDLVMMVKMLCRTVRKYTPKSQQAENFTAYLQKEGLISAADCLRDSDPLDTESEDRHG
ncbi:hypothetical protein DN619_20115 [Klebsiella michiganensis]|uniref:hypothetical protein n=1 Tax=Klebsiella TaxID=570 RepID=UPI000FEC122B|nr:MULTISPECIES: hypothetical protein [Klebsiella]EIX9361077.1 hypothetical protein [Klebsiella pneumoniae]MBG1978553.1 hypothetical protein [Klebsiella pneumoniae]MBG2010063.1 hypothetical protein [Klebsiella pneumoniae]MBG2434617.1 hypothetical protein [Klebsiella pneumoniae]RWT41567.1 hypothetical protein DN619_20115 [Klebsiella michiganensis]